MSYQTVLQRLHAEADKSDTALRAQFKPEKLQESMQNPRAFYHEMRQQYLAIDEAFGKFLSMCARMMRAETVIEFGTSFGISTIYLAQALKDNGKGRVITTEYEAGKVVVAQKNIDEAGLRDFVEIRQGDALETLKDLKGTIDLVFLDGAKNLYVPLLQLLEPRFRKGTFIASDNSRMSTEFVAYLRQPGSGYLSTDISGRQDNELAVWTGRQ